MCWEGIWSTIRVQVLNGHIPTLSPYYTCFDPNPKYLIIGYSDPLRYTVGQAHTGDQIGAWVWGSRFFGVRVEG